ncbi:hypothetical protein K502DRAFT_310168 [Neoconidiobolus thromboides FSU 785]|nr:hypothetical protein K502DRAFT_310168 [Neoconidiobolus thromboides FSU 785]
MLKALYSNIIRKCSNSTPNIFVSESQVSGFSLIAKRHKKRKPALTVKLLTYVEKLGQAGDIIKVRPGHMRNDLYPNQLAQYVLKDKNQIHRAQLELNKTKQEDKPEATSSKQSFVQYMRLARIHRELQNIEQVSFTRAVIGSDGMLYGSVTNEDLIRYLRDQHYLVIDKESLQLDKIKKIGTYFAKVNLDTIGVHNLKVIVIPDTPIEEIVSENQINV